MLFRAGPSKRIKLSPPGRWTCSKEQDAREWAAHTHRATASGAFQVQAPPLLDGPFTHSKVWLTAITVFVSMLAKLLHGSLVGMAITQQGGETAYFERWRLVCRSSIKWVCGHRLKSSPDLFSVQITFGVFFNDAVWLSGLSEFQLSNFFHYLFIFDLVFLRIPFGPPQQI